MLLVACNGVEREPSVEWLLAAKLFQLVADTHFRLSASFYGRLEPMKPFYQSDAVFQHGMTHALLFGLVLDGLHGCHRRRFADDFVGLDLTSQRFVYFVRVDEDVPFAPLLQGIACRFVWPNCNVLLSQIVFYVSSQFAFIDKQGCLLTTNQQMTDKHRTAVHVAASQIQCPGNVIELTHQHTVGMYLTQSFANAA